MLTALNRSVGMTPKQTLAEVKKDIDEFVGEAPQFDDLTMLAFEVRTRE